MNQRGFTLVELLVALTIFALISAAGVTLLRASIDTQTAVSKRLSEGGGVNRLRAILATELASAQPRAVRDESGNPLPAFVAESGGIAFVHAADSGTVDGTLSRSRYALESGALVRQATDRIDGASPGDAAPLVRDVTAMRWRYRSFDGGWSDNWQADDPARLPRAVELTLERRRSAPLVLRFLVGPDGLPPPGQQASDNPA
jgi:general secretion pathway protein J